MARWQPAKWRPWPPSVPLPTCAQNYTGLLTGELKGAPIICIANGGSIRSSVPVGNITEAAIIDIFPFGNWWVGGWAAAVLADGPRQAISWALLGSPFCHS